MAYRNVHIEEFDLEEMGVEYRVLYQMDDDAPDSENQEYSFATRSEAEEFVQELKSIG